MRTFYVKVATQFGEVLPVQIIDAWSEDGVRRIVKSRGLKFLGIESSYENPRRRRRRANQWDPSPAEEQQARQLELFEREHGKRRKPAVRTNRKTCGTRLQVSGDRRTPRAARREARVGHKVPDWVANPELVTLLANPTTAADFAAGLAAFRRFHATNPKAVRRIGRGKRVLVALGELREVVYSPRRGQRKGPAFFHRFRPGAVLAASTDGKELRIISAGQRGRRFRVDWSRGIVG